MRSRTGCLTCRQRKLKCDEGKPSCGQCTKASRECVPCEGIVFRHQHNASMNGEDAGDGCNQLKGFYAYKNTFDQESVWLEIPEKVANATRVVTFINTTNPYEDEPGSPEYPGAVETPGMYSQSSFEHFRSNSWHSSSSPQKSTNGTTEPQANIELPVGAPASAPSLPPLAQLHPTAVDRHRLSPPVSMTSSSHALNFILNPSSGTSFPVYRSSPFLPSLTNRFEDSVDDNQKTVEDHEIAYLLRYFSEGPGLWMDLFDLGTYFASYVPAKAQENPLLKYAAVAYAAKAIGRVQGKKPTVGGNASRVAYTEMYADAFRVNWFDKATEYYDRALSLLRKGLHEERDIEKAGSEDDETLRWPKFVTSTDTNESAIQRKRRRLSIIPPRRTSSDELLAATAILSVYEFLDASECAWWNHLNGAKGILDVAKERMMPLQLPSPDSPVQQRLNTGISKARKATFWNIARQDMLAAFIKKTCTRLDPDDLAMWKEAGLLITQEGSIQPSNTTASGYPEGDSGSVMKEDMISNALIWLMSKLINFMASGQVPSPSSGGSFTSVHDYWHHLERLFNDWHDGLPITFKPCARISPPVKLNDELNKTLLPEVWYSIPMCASTMQSYYMSLIYLILNRPRTISGDPFDVYRRVRLEDRQLVTEAQRHSREIISIALSRPEASVRIHSTQPLYTAGQCLMDPEERRLVGQLLHDIEQDIGWATEYRVRHLLELWNRPELGGP
ncbi:hypothetical protein BDY21DRAFT_398090 [Lineolata rhizophorae]|uniref:Zn(2)-C6 fungal-type domain-containing protein n=1 Tax=Lineolata rhizophorae TaxID=578093 RepID=A0A6A6PCP2_9PEZI|nr:hypothetical protein BDY21DRAFT_398090 [Lineolata rhizophorae]